MLLASGVNVFIEVGIDMEVACCMWSKDTKRRKCRVWCDLWTVISEYQIGKICVGRIRDWVVLITGNGISIRIRSCSDVSAICNRKPLIPRAEFHPRTIFVLSKKILL